jgi:hypothetical protein
MNLDLILYGFFSYLKLKLIIEKLKLKKKIIDIATTKFICSINSDCNNNGVCFSNLCYCFVGFSGTKCMSGYYSNKSYVLN